jgi:hypothetical protein
MLIRKLDRFKIYEVSGGEKVFLMNMFPKDEHSEIKDDDDLAHKIEDITDLFFDNSKLTLSNKQGISIVIKGMENKSFVIEAILVQKSVTEK